MNKKFSKVMLVSASAAALFAAYPSIAPEGEVFGLEPAISVEASTNARAFVKAASELPSLSTIAKLNTNNFEAARKDIQAVRNSYNRLSSSDKKRSDVVKWEGYLTQKEQAVGNNFITAAMKLPSVSAIAGSKGSALAKNANDIAKARALYAALPAKAKANAQVSKWEGYLAQKEAALPSNATETFVNAVLGLPNLNQIKAMNTAQITATQGAIRTARNLYNRLSAAEKADADVVKWEGYLTQKEEPVGITFISQVGDLPSVSAIADLNEDALAKVAKDAKEARASYDDLTTAAKADAQVVKWEGYLTQKEDAIADNQVEGLVVREVHDITPAGVEIVIAAPEENLLGVNVNVVDNYGRRVATKATDIPKGRTHVTFDFAKRLDWEDLKGVWTVDGIEFNFDEFALVDEIVEAAERNRHLDLVTALNEAGIVGVSDNLVRRYAEEITEAAQSVHTFEDVQKIITQVNKDAGVRADGSEVLNALAKAKSELAIYNVLKNNFDDVNSTWAPEYRDNLKSFDRDDYSTRSAAEVKKALADVQNRIYAVNHAQISEREDRVTTAAGQAEITALLDRWVEDYSGYKKADLIYNSRLDEKRFVVNAAEKAVRDAKTENSLYDALRAYESAVADHNAVAKYAERLPELKGLALANKGYYFAERKEGSPQAIVNAGNAKAKADSDRAKALAAAVAAAEKAQADYLAAGGDRTAKLYTNVTEAIKFTKEGSGSISNLNDHVDALKDATAKLVKHSKALARAEDAQADYLAAGGSANNELYTQLTEAIEHTIYGGGSAVNLDSYTVELEEATEELVLVSSVKNARTASQLQAALVKLGDSSYNNLSNAQRLEVADLFLDTVKESNFKTSDAIREALADEVSDYRAAINAVNDAVETRENRLTSVRDAIADLDTAKFEELTAAQKLVAAESVIDNAPRTEKGKVIYTTIAQIVNNF